MVLPSNRKIQLLKKHSRNASKWIWGARVLNNKIHYLFSQQINIIPQNSRSSFWMTKHAVSWAHSGAKLASLVCSGLDVEPLAFSARGISLGTYGSSCGSPSSCYGASQSRDWDSPWRIGSLARCDLVCEVELVCLVVSSGIDHCIYPRFFCTRCFFIVCSLWEVFWIWFPARNMHPHHIHAVWEKWGGDGKTA